MAKKITAFDRESAVRPAAGSLGLTLGRLGDSVRRLGHEGARTRGGDEEPAPPGRALEPAALARLNQTLRLTADAWRLKEAARRQWEEIENRLDRLKAATARPNLPAGRRPRLLEYYLMAQALYDLKQAGPARL